MQALSTRTVDEVYAERRADVRFTPRPPVAVLFGHAAIEVPTAGLITDVSLGGCRIMAPPTARPHLHWGDPFRLQVAWSDAARDAGVEGLRLGAHVVRLVADAHALVVHCQFSIDGSDGDWERFVAWIARLEGMP